jgi:poly-gamma-glutamate synthesis protein (capsule biosynthesis protein)
MAADNTSAFNCRTRTGGTEWSEHAYGRAIDLNPVENPYVLGDHVAPLAGRAFTDRLAAPGVILAGDVVVRAFAAVGWTWGGTWDRPVDYQHFSVSGR